MERTCADILMVQYQDLRRKLNWANGKLMMPALLVGFLT